MSSSPYRQLLANTDFRRLYFARLISFAGDWFAIVPLLGLVYELTDSSLATAAVLTSNALPMFFLSPIGGNTADRRDRRKIMITASVASATIALLLLTVEPTGSALLGLSLAAGLSASNAFFFPASSSSLPNLVAPQLLAPANILIGSAWGTMAAVGAALGGLFATVVSRDAAFAVDAISFLIAGLLVSRIRTPLSEKRERTTSSFWDSTGEAIRLARSNKQIGALLTAKAGFGLIAGGGIALFPILSTDEFDMGDAGTGLLFAARGVGALVGPIVYRRLMKNNDVRLLRSIGYMMSIWGLGYIALSFAPGAAVAGLGIAFAHTGGGSQWAFSSFGLQSLTSDEIRGRILAFDIGLGSLTAATSQLGIGYLAELVAPRTLLLGSAILGIAFGLGWSRVTRPALSTLEEHLGS
jgi:MFS family permease